MDHAGKIAIVTGGTGALGSVIVRYLLNAGASVAIPWNSEKSLSSFRLKDSEDPHRILLRRTDITSEEEGRAFVDGVVNTYGTIDYLINAAGGYTGGKPIADVTLKEWESMIGLNLTATFLMCRAALGIMQPKNFGRIVTIAAMTALSPAAKKGPYAVSKRGVITLTETIAEEVKGTGITANAIAPSIILTEANKQWMATADEGAWVTPGEIASLALFLCSYQARSISGNAVKIYGRV